jgi:apolipoprotein N-acyltransferase
MVSAGAPVRFLLAASSGLLLAASFPLPACWYLAWVSLVPLLLAVRASPGPRAAANLGGVTGLVFYGLSLQWFFKVLGMASPALWCMLALWPALFCVVAWFTMRGRYGGPGWPVIAGLAWCGIEYFRSEIWLVKFAWLGLGFSQAPVLPVLQVCSLVGVYGLSAVIVAFNCAVFLFVARRDWRPLAAASVALLAVLVWGNARLGRFPTGDGRPVKVALLQDESLGLDRQVRISGGKGARDAGLLVWPEYSFMIQPGREKRYLEMLNGKLSGLGSVKVIGAAVIPSDTNQIKYGEVENVVLVLEPGGRLVGRYAKMHPIPFVEPFLVPNANPRAVKTSIGILGIQICYDLDFENGSRLVAAQGAEILAVPNMDPWEWGRLQHDQHSAMPPVRAVETGLWVVRAASSGSSQVISPVGRVVYGLGFGKEGVLTGYARMSRSSTVYTRFGWVLAPASLVFTIGLLGWFAFGRFRRKGVGLRNRNKREAMEKRW